MKTNRTQETVFAPVTLSFTCESLDEYEAMKAMCNSAYIMEALRALKPSLRENFRPHEVFHGIGTEGLTEFHHTLARILCALNC